jgi:F-type H+-transporting ATPase subunit a
MLIGSGFQLVFYQFSCSVIAQDHKEEANQEATHGEEKKKGFDAQEVIFGHVLNAHEFHFSICCGPITIPLPVILYSSARGFNSFMSSRFNHGHDAYDGYKLEDGKVVAVDSNGNIDESVKVYDLSLTRNVVQMLLALVIFVWIMLLCKRYQAGYGVTPHQQVFKILWNL